MNRMLQKIYGCEAAATIANAMGDVPETNTYLEIEQRWGFVDSMMPQNKWGHDGSLADKVEKPEYGYDLHFKAHTRPAGMTEDGHERHRLMTSAILKKNGRITIDDLAAAWREDIDPEKFGYLLGPQDQIIYYSLKAGVPPWEVGRYASWPGFMGTAKMMIPVGIVNACNPIQAARDAEELARIKDVKGVKGNYAVEVACAVAAATAEALKSDATVDSIIDAALEQLSSRPRKEVLEGLNYAKKVKDWKVLRVFYHEKYDGHPMSNAVEVLSSGLACFWLAQGNTRNAILWAVNLGRDCDCRAYVSGGLSGALSGIESVPKEWVRLVEKVAKEDPYTVSRRTAYEAAEGLYRAMLNNAQMMKAVTDDIFDRCSIQR